MLYQSGTAIGLLGKDHGARSTCRAKSNAIDAPAITNYATYSSATFTGKAGLQRLLKSGQIPGAGHG